MNSKQGNLDSSDQDAQPPSNGITTPLDGTDDDDGSPGANPTSARNQSGTPTESRTSPEPGEE